MPRTILVLLICLGLINTVEGQKTAPELLKQAVICSEAGSLEAAIELCNQAIALNPKYELAYFQRAIANELKGDIKKAIGDYTTTIQLNSKNIQAHLNRGILYKKLKKTWAALRDFNAARSIDVVYTLSFLSGQAIKSLF
jgi:tetratricopeptide (TPR) repeat protein